MSSAPTPECVLCRSARVNAAAHVHGRDYFVCDVCRLTFMTPAQRLHAAAERARYDTHQNDPADARYREFLSRLADPLVERLPLGAAGLDYGSGPGPTLSGMLRERGFEMSIYDPFYAPDAGALRRTYDFITCTETVEHFFSPADEFARLKGLLHPGGWLGIMTEMRDDEHAFETWWYVRDPTHVCFYHPATLEWIAIAHGWTLERPQRNVALFRNTAGKNGE